MSLEGVENFLKYQVQDAKTLQNIRGDCLQGPQGLPACKTVVSLSMLKDQLIAVKQLTMDKNKEFLKYIDMRSFLTLANENLHGI